MITENENEDEVNLKQESQNLTDNAKNENNQIYESEKEEKEEMYETIKQPKKDEFTFANRTPERMN